MVEEGAGGEKEGLSLGREIGGRFRFNKQIMEAVLSSFPLFHCCFLLSSFSSSCPYFLSCSCCFSCSVSYSWSRYEFSKLK